MKRVVFLVFSLTVFITVSALTSVSAQAQAYLPMLIQGAVTEYHPADCAKDGSITIAGRTFVIAAGTDTFFLDAVQVVTGTGLGIAIRRSEVWQIVGTGRAMGVYLDGDGRIRLQLITSLAASPNVARLLDITGVVGAVGADSIKINGATFPTTGMVAAAVGPNPVRITGSINNNGELSGAATVNPNPFRTLTICTAPNLYFSAGVGFVGDPNPFDYQGPISGFVTSFETGPNFICDNSVEVLGVDGVANIPLAPNFSLSSVVSKDVNACYELKIDMFNWITSGSKKIAGTGNTISGVLTRAVVQGYGKRPTDPAPPFPTALSEVAQRGSVQISGVTFTIAPNHAVTIDAGVSVGGNVCLRPVVDATGENVDYLGLWQAPRRAGQFLTGSRLFNGACP
ncbi:MAG: hypothetical protein JMDDDDMK_02641 [Acidobacteria bacterium]|nr:hypothetical protein [Acidobacteriota bacterium]